jgi:hypothetical protein
MHIAFPALADKEEAKIIYAYLCRRNKQFCTAMNIYNKAIEVKLK